MTETRRSSRRWVVWSVAGLLLAAFVVLACLSRLVPGVAEWDRAITERFIEWRTPGWTSTFWVFTLLGDDSLMAALAAAMVLLAVTRGRRSRAATVAVGLAAGWALMHLGKAAAGRARPAQTLALIETPASHSMPSGHALISVVFTGLAVYMLIDWLGRQPRSAGRAGDTGPAAGAARPPVWAGPVAGVAIAAAVAIAGFVGMSRVYLGVHWLSDVIAGWCLGGAVLLTALLLAPRWRRAGRLRRVLRDTEPWANGWGRAGVALMLLVIVCAAAGLTAWADPLL